MRFLKKNLLLAGVCTTFLTGYVRANEVVYTVVESNLQVDLDGATMSQETVGIRPDGTKERVGFIMFHEGVPFIEDYYLAGHQRGFQAVLTSEGQILGISRHEGATMNGPSVSFHDNGVIMRVVYYKNGIPEGLLFGYWSNGELSAKGTYASGALKEGWTKRGVGAELERVVEDGEGIFVSYDETGRELFRVLFKEGQPVRQKPEQPVLLKEGQPARQKPEQPVLLKEEQPARQKPEQPVLLKEEQPARQKLEQPALPDKPTQD